MTFEDEIAYESYEAIEKRRLGGLFKGIATVLAIGAVVALVAFTGGAVLGAVVVRGRERNGGGDLYA